MRVTFTPDQIKIRKARLKDFTRVMNDFMFVIENSTYPSDDIQDAIDAIEYYNKSFKELQPVLSNKK